MKYEVKWTANNQVVESDYVESLNNSGARSQVESMRGNMPGFKVIGVYGVSDSNPNSTSTNVTHRESGIDDDLSATIAGISVVAGGLVALIGLFMLPVGIIAGVIGGAIGWLGWKLADWLHDRGW